MHVTKQGDPESRSDTVRDRGLLALHASGLPVLLTSLFLLIRVQNLEERLVRLRLMTEALLDRRYIRNRVIKLSRLR